jgi:hypothetical protein
MSVWKATAIATVAFISCACEGAAVPAYDASRATSEPALALWRDRPAQDDDHGKQAPQPIYSAGSRLQVRVRDGGGEALQPIGLQDSQLGVVCRFALAEDGERRCLPLDAPGGVYFADAECSRRIYADPRASAGACAPVAFTYSARASSPSCDEEPLLRVYRTGDAAPDGMIYASTPAGCLPLTAAGCRRELVPEPATSFVRGTYREQTVDGALDAVWIDYDDGARVLDHLRDRARDAECRPEPELAGARCLPVEQAQAYEPQFADAACSGGRVAVDYSRVRPCMRARVAVTSALSECGSYERRLYELGEQLPTLYVGDQGACVERPPQAGEIDYRIGAPLALGSLPLLGQRTANNAAERLALRSYFGDGDQQLLAAGFFDRALGRDCEAERFRDGILRCVPRNSDGSAPLRAGTDGPYADPDCTTLLLALPARPEACDAGSDMVRVLATPASALDSVRRLGVRVDAPATVYARENTRGTCIALRSHADVAYYTLDETVDLAPISERVE